MTSEVSKKLFLTMEGGVHDHNAQCKNFWGPSRPFKMTLFGTFLRIEIVKMLEFYDLTAEYTYISLYTVYLDNFRVVGAENKKKCAFFH